MLARLAFWSVASTVENNSSVDNVALAALVVSGHKAINSRFLEQSACAALTMINSARTLGNFDGDAVIMMGPLGANSPHDLASWRSAQKGWIAQHDAHARQLAALLDSTKSQTRTIDLVPLLLSNAYPFMKRNLNYMKLAVYTLDRYDKVVFVDLDIIIVRPLSDILALSTESVELVGYRTCTAPVNSGFFIVRPRGVNGRRRLQHLNDITLRNKCPCRSAKEPFASSGFDNWGEIAQDLVSLWTKGTHASPSQPKYDDKLCHSILKRKERTWDLAGAGTGQGLMWFYFALKINSYISVTYADLPLVHYNAPGPKPWAANAQKVPPHLKDRQDCDFIWWTSFLGAQTEFPRPTFGSCIDLLLPHLKIKRAAGHFVVPACCRTCPGGGHFSTARACIEKENLTNYAQQSCRVAAELNGAFNARGAVEVKL